MTPFETIPDVVAAARERLEPHVWDYVSGGSECEVTLRRNRAAFQRLAFRPRVLRDVGAVDTRTTALGQVLALPVMCAPVGSIGLFDPAGAAAVARAAQARGTAAFVGTLSSPSLEETRAAADGPLFFQLYPLGPRSWVRDILGRVEAAGFDAVCLTVDSAVYGRRERDRRNRFSRMGTEERPNLAGLEDPDLRRMARVTWQFVDWLRAQTSLPLILKGVQTGEDAALAVDHGADAVYVSNHGGRQLDHGLATLDVLPEVVAAIGTSAEIVVDSGFMRGTDVLKALCLGARAVSIGKLMCWGLAAGGAAGLERVLELLLEEMTAAMAMLGTARISELGPRHVTAADPPPDVIWPAPTPGN